MRPRPLPILMVALFALCTGASCGGDDEKSAKTGSQSAAVTVGVCGRDVSVYDAARTLTGGAIIGGRHVEKGGAAHELLGGLVAGMLLNGIDFVALKDFEIDFADGRYTFKTGNDQLGFRLFFAEDFGDYRQGDPIPHNIFALDSYVTDVDVNVGGTPLDPDIDYDISWGPLADLVDGDLDISGRDPRDLKISVKLHAEAIGFALESVQRDTFEVPLADFLGLVTGRFDYQVHMNTPPIAVPALAEALHTGGYGVSFTGSYVKSEYLFDSKVMQRTDVSFDDADFLILEDDDGGYWDGEYLGTHDVWYRDYGGTAQTRLSMRGLGSTRNPNYTEYYCDADRTQLWGRADHKADMTGGTLTLANGKHLNYGIGPVETDDFREGDDPTD
jgi:hypothetical protein